MRQNVPKKGPQPVLLNSISSYNTSIVITQLSDFIHKPRRPCIYSTRKLVTELDSATYSDVEAFYSKTLENDTSLPLDSYLVYGNPTLISFFATQMIDIPYCLKKIKYAHSSTASNVQLRLISSLVRHGKRQTISKFYSESAQNISQRHFYARSNEFDIDTWNRIYFVFSYRKFSTIFKGTATPTSIRLSRRSELYNKRGELFTPTLRLTSDYAWFNELLFHELRSSTPSFSFFVNSVNKLKRRHSRGKSGKYEIIWKYVPQYKRILVVLRWLVKDIQFQKAKTLKARIESSLETLLFNKTKHLVHQLRHFVHRFVFYRHRKTLLTTLRTVY